MKKFGIACAALVVCASMVASASAADRAVAKSTLSSMGLGSMQQLSDNDGLAIRGKGTSASVWGRSSTSIFGQSASNGYRASVNKLVGPSEAGGGSNSVSGAVGGIGGSFGGGGFFVIGGAIGFAGGGASAYAK